MKIAILGGGFTGLTAAYYLAKKKHQVTLFEKEKYLGGLAAGFKIVGWDWYLERAIHHIFVNDHDILNFAQEVGFKDIFFREPETASLYKNPKFSSQKKQDNFSYQDLRIFPLDDLSDLLKFPLLSFPQKLRMGLVLLFLKCSPFLKFYEKQTAVEFLKKSMGETTWNILWEQLFRKKFGKYAEKILASFIWARIKKRTKKLGYIKGGFQNFINYLETRLKSLNVKVIKGFPIEKVLKTKDGYQIVKSFQNLSNPTNVFGYFDLIISTLPTPVLIAVGKNLFPGHYLAKLGKIRYLQAISLILQTDKPILPKTYWLNVTPSEVPLMGIFQQTNFIDKKYYGGKHICYCGWYVEKKDKLWQMDKKEIFNFAQPYLKKISPINYQVLNSYLFKSPYAQPIFDDIFLKNKPDFITPAKNFFIANLDMTYPYDRGTNYAVKLGKTIAGLIK